MCRVTVLLGLLPAGALEARGQELEIPLSPSPVGSGARAAGMANAFIAIADDATAASWNPAGLVQLEEPEASIVGAFNAISEQFLANYHPEFKSRPTDENFELNFLSAAYPLPFLILGRNAVVSLNYQRKFDFARKLDFDFDSASVLSTGTVVNRFLTLDFEQSGGLSAITPTFAMEITKTLSVGVAVNLWRSTFLGENDWEQTTRIDALGLLGSAPLPSTQTVNERYHNFHGENVSVGVLWNAAPKWNLGLRYDSAFVGNVDYTKRLTRLDLVIATLAAPSMAVLPLFQKRTEQRLVSFPDTLAVGVACRVNDKLTLALDISRTDWNDFYVKDGRGAKFSLIDASDLGNALTRTDLDPTFTVRFGAEYVFIPKHPGLDLKRLWTVRGGLFYDEEPASGRSTRDLQSRGDGDPDRFYGFAAGGGLQAFHRFNFDMAYQLRWGPGVNSDFIRGVSGFEEDVIQHRVLLSSVVYFSPPAKRPARPIRWSSLRGLGEGRSEGISPKAPGRQRMKTRRGRMSKKKAGRFARSTADVEVR